MQKHFAIATGISMLAIAGVVVLQRNGGMQGSMRGSLVDVPASSSSVSSVSSSTDLTPWCNEVCGEYGLCCDQLIGGGFPTCKKCGSCEVVDDLNASFCCSSVGIGNYPAACCAYNPNYCTSSSSVSSSKKGKSSSMTSCVNKTNSRPGWGVSAVHTYTDASGTKGRSDAYTNAGADALVQAGQACNGLTVGVCDMGCGTVPPLIGPNFTAGPKGTQCTEQLVQPGVHAVTCRIDGTCSVTRNCATNY